MKKKKIIEKIKCPFCGKKKCEEITYLLVKKVRDSSVLFLCPDCSSIFGRVS